MTDSISANSLSGINSDGTLKKFDCPTPTTKAAIAASKGDEAQLSKLQAAELIAPDETRNTPLIWSADAGKTKAVQYILSVVEREDPKSVNTKGFLGNTALSRAARGGHLGCVSAILQASEVNPNIHNEKKQYPLHFAAYKRHPEIVKVMLDSNKCFISM